jgi:hypothetical protein
MKPVGLKILGIGTAAELGAPRPGVWYESRIDMSKKAGFLDMFLGYVQDVDMSVPELIWL